MPELLAEVRRICSREASYLLTDDCLEVLFLQPGSDEAARAQALLEHHEKQRRLEDHSLASTMRNLDRIEALKMEEQANVYRRMGTRQSIEAAEFLYKEIGRRYPGTSAWGRVPANLLELDRLRKRGRSRRQERQQDVPATPEAERKDMTAEEKREKAGRLLREAEGIDARGAVFVYETARGHCVEILRRAARSPEAEEAALWLELLQRAINRDKGLPAPKPAIPPAPARPKLPPKIWAKPFDPRNSIVREKSPKV